MPSPFHRVDSVYPSDEQLHGGETGAVLEPTYLSPVEERKVDPYILQQLQTPYPYRSYSPADYAHMPPGRTIDTT